MIKDETTPIATLPRLLASQSSRLIGKPAALCRAYAEWCSSGGPRRGKFKIVRTQINPEAEAPSQPAFCQDTAYDGTKYGRHGVRARDDGNKEGQLLL
jgi:hypothetical protein